MRIDENGYLVRENHITTYDECWNDITEHDKYKVNTDTGLFEKVED